MLFNTLTAAGTYADDKLFATPDTKTRARKLEVGTEVLLSDTVGFVRDLPHNLVASFKATLEEAVHADLLLHVLDVGHPHAQQQYDSVQGAGRNRREGFHRLCPEGKPELALLNKIDTEEGDEQYLFTRSWMDQSRSCRYKTRASTSCSRPSTRRPRAAGGRHARSGRDERPLTQSIESNTRVTGRDVVDGRMQIRAR